MNRTLRIAVADDELDMREYFQKILSHLGFQVVAVAKDGQELVEKCLECDPDLIVTDIKMPRLDGIEAATQIYLHKPVPIILVSAYHNAELIERAEADHVLGYLVKPIKQADLEPAIALTMRRFEQFQALCRETNNASQAIDERNRIEDATAVLVQRSNLTEEQALQRLQTLAEAKQIRVAELASMILTACEAFDSLGEDG